MAIADKDGDGEVDYTELVKMTEDKDRLAAQAELVKASSLATEAMQVTPRPWRGRPSPAQRPPSREKGVTLAQKTSVGPCIAVRTQLQKAEAGPTHGPTRRRSPLVHFD